MGGRYGIERTAERRENKGWIGRQKRESKDKENKIKI